MSENRPDLGSTEISEAREWWAARTHRYALLVGSAATSGIGLSLTLAGQLAWGHYVSVALLLAGAGMLAGSTAVRPRATTETPANPSVAPGPLPTGFVDVNPGFAVVGLGRTPSCTGHSPREFPARSDVRARISATGRSDPAEFLWESWSPSVGRLPVELVGPVPETAYVAPRAGRPQLHEEGEPVVLEPSYFEDDGIDWGMRTPFGGPVVLTPHPLASTSDNAAEPSVSANTTPATARRTTVSRTSIGGAAFGTQVLTEALDPTPPHLRPNRSPAKLHAAHRIPSGNSLSHPTRCADCRQLIREPKIWRRCPDCHRQLCTHCIVEALVAYEEGWCPHCAGLRHLDMLTRELAPRARSGTPLTSARVTVPLRSPRFEGGLRPGKQRPGRKEPDRTEGHRISRESGGPLVNPPGSKPRHSTGGYAASLLRQFGGELTPHSGPQLSNGAGI